MATKTPNMSHVTAEPFYKMTKPDRLEFRKMLDLYFKALRADWAFHVAHKNLGMDAAMDHGHAAATAWSACTVSLHVIRDMRNADTDLRVVAGILRQTTPENLEHIAELHKHATKVLELAKEHKRSPLGLADLFEEAFHLLEAYRGNLALMDLQNSI